MSTADREAKLSYCNTIQYNYPRCTLSPGTKRNDWSYKQRWLFLCNAPLAASQATSCKGTEWHYNMLNTTCSHNSQLRWRAIKAVGMKEAVQRDRCTQGTATYSC